MTIFKQLANMADEIMFTIEDYEVYGNSVKVRSFNQGLDQILSWELICWQKI